jgi:hypothetical protein
MTTTEFIVFQRAHSVERVQAGCRLDRFPAKMSRRLRGDAIHNYARRLRGNALTCRVQNVQGTGEVSLGGNSSGTPVRAGAC